MTELEFINGALGLLGEKQLSGLLGTDVTTKAVLVALPILRDAALRGHRWNWAVSEPPVLLVAAVVPHVRYSHAYLLPNDVIRVVSLLDGGAGSEIGDFARNSTHVFLNSAAAPYLSYVQRITDVAKWDASFSEALMSMLAGRVASVLRGANSAGTELYKAGMLLMDEAKRLDANEGRRALRDWPPRRGGDRDQFDQY